MAGGYKHQKVGLEDLGEQLRTLREQIAAQRKALTGLGLQVDPVSGDLIVAAGRGIRLAGGPLTMYAEDGTPLLHAGPEPIPDGSGRTQRTFKLGRDDGTLVFALGDYGTTPGHSHQQDLFWFDHASNTIFADDAVSGVGVARPHLAASTLVDTNIVNWFQTAATTWTDIASCFVERQNAKLSWTIALAAGAAITGQFRLLCNGTQIGTTQTVTNTVAYWSDDAAWPTSVPVFTDVYLELQALVSAGSGTVAAQCLRLRGNQS